MWRKQLKQIEHLCSNQNNEEFIERVLNHALEQLKSTKSKSKSTKQTISTILTSTILLTTIIIIVLVAFSSIFYDTTIQWLNFDDYTNFRDNEHVKDGFSAESSRWAFENGVVLGVYEPLSLHFKMLIFQFFSEARYFLCVSVIVHILNTISTYRLSRTMFPDVSERFHLISTLFWSVHPLRVEVVAWASAQPYLLCTFCGIWSIYYAEKNWYWMSLFLFACSTLFKSASISLVFALAAWRFRKGKSLTSLIPHAIMCCLLVMKTLSIKEGAALLRELTPLDRVYVRIRAWNITCISFIVTRKSLENTKITTKTELTRNVCTPQLKYDTYQVPCLLRHLFLLQEHNSSSESTWALSCTLLVLVFCFSYHRSMVPYRRSMVQSIDGTDNKVKSWISLSLCLSLSLPADTHVPTSRYRISCQWTVSTACRSYFVFF